MKLQQDSLIFIFSIIWTLDSPDNPAQSLQVGIIDVSLYCVHIGTYSEFENLRADCKKKKNMT